MALNLDEIKRELNPTNKEKFFNELERHDIPTNTDGVDLLFRRPIFPLRSFIELLTGVKNPSAETCSYYIPLYKLYLKAAVDQINESGKESEEYTYRGICKLFLKGYDEDD